MKASEKKIKDLFSEAKTFFAIPVYQRDYNWQEKHCKQLFEEIQILLHILLEVLFIFMKGFMEQGKKNSMLLMVNKE